MYNEINHKNDQVEVQKYSNIFKRAFIPTNLPQIGGYWERFIDLMNPFDGYIDVH